MTNTLTDQFIDETYKGFLHSRGGELPSSGIVDIYDGNGNKTPVSMGRDGNGIEIRTPLKIGTLDYPSDNGGTSVGSILTQTEPNKLSLQNASDVYLQVVNLIYPVNSIFLSFDNINPSIRFSGTTWVQVSQGRFLVGAGTGNDGSSSKTFQSGNNSGEYDHTLTISEIPEHNHILSISGGDRCDGWDCYDSSKPLNPEFGSGQGGYRESDTMRKTGNDQPHNNTPPGYGVYVWRRTS